MGSEMFSARAHVRFAAWQSALQSATRWVLVLLVVLALAGCSEEEAETTSSEVVQGVDYCAQVSTDELAVLYDKELFPAPLENGCMWSERPGGMAYFQFAVYRQSMDLRRYFDEQLPSHVRLVDISDLGDEGLMTVSEGSLGVIVVRKGDRVLQSAATFLEIEPGSEKQKVLWDIYRRILSL